MLGYGFDGHDSATDARGVRSEQTVAAAWGDGSAQPDGGVNWLAVNSAP